jgi:hypothetical protein
MTGEGIRLLSDWGYSAEGFGTIARKAKSIAGGGRNAFRLNRY